MMNLKIDDLEGKNALVKIKGDIKKNKLVRDDRFDRTLFGLQVVGLWICFIVVMLGFLAIYFIALCQYFGKFSTSTDFKWLIPYSMVSVLSIVITYALSKKK